MGEIRHLVNGGVLVNLVIKKYSGLLALVLLLAML
jgi:hypothetical protein